MAHHPPSLVAQFHAVLTHGTGPKHYLLVGVVFAGLVPCLWYICALIDAPFHRWWFGKWVYNEQTRDWHRVIIQDPMGEMIDMTTHDQRRALAAEKRKERLWGMLALGVIIGAAVLQWAFTGKLEGNHPFLGIILVTFAALSALVSPFVLIPELLYLSGNQHIDGARVLHPIPLPPPGAEVLVGAKGHGNAGPAPLDKIRDVLSGNRSGEPETVWKE